MTEILLALAAGTAAGTLNAMGGGGTFVALPALVHLGLQPVTANAAATVALAPGAVAGAWVYRREAGPVGGASAASMTSVSVAGGLLGAGLLLALPARSFGAAVPWLLLFATLLLAVRRRLYTLVATRSGRPAALGARAVLAGQFVLAVYGGYFGGAVGIMMLALWGAGLGIDPAAGNPMRVIQLAAVYAASAGLFLLASDVLAAPWPLAGMLTGAVAGGFGGAHLARCLPERLLRAVIMATAAGMTALYFLRG